MKTFYSLIIVGVVGLSSCSATYTASRGGVDDDVYYSRSDSRQGRNNAQGNGNSQYYGNSNSSNGQNADTTGYYGNNQANTQNGDQQDGSDDNYYDDYNYTARIYRFSYPAYSFGYFDPFYAPYAGFGYFDPFYAPYAGFSVGFGFGWGGFYSPYYGGWGGLYSPYYGGWGGLYRPYYRGWGHYYGGYGYRHYDNRGYYSHYNGGVGNFRPGGNPYTARRAFSTDPTSSSFGGSSGLGGARTASARGISRAVYNAPNRTGVGIVNPANRTFGNTGAGAGSGAGSSAGSSGMAPTRATGAGPSAVGVRNPMNYSRGGSGFVRSGSNVSSFSAAQQARPTVRSNGFFGGNRNPGFGGSNNSPRFNSAPRSYNAPNRSFMGTNRYSAPSRSFGGGGFGGGGFRGGGGGGGFRGGGGGGFHGGGGGRR